MPGFAQDALNEGVKKREVFGWAMYDFANSGYTTVVLTAVFNAYFVGVVAGGAAWGTLAWTLALGLSNLVVMLTMPALGAYADLRAAKKRLLMLTTAGCVRRHRLAGRCRARRPGARGGGHRAVEHLLLVWRVADGGLPARTGAPRSDRPRLGLGLELRLLRRHAARSA